MSERERRDESDERRPDEEEPRRQRGYRIPGRDFAGATYAADEEEQTADRRLETEWYRADDGRMVGDAEQDRPRDES